MSSLRSTVPVLHPEIMMKFFIVALLSSLPAVGVTDSAIFCSPKPATAVHCEDVTLQCHLDPPQDATNMMVEWRHGHNNDIVHLYRDRKDNPAEQKEPFEGRTSLFREGLTKGNLSLKLSTVALSDAGRYRCSIHTDKLQKSCYVNLTVGESKVIGSHDPVTVRVGYDVILPCHLEPPFDVRTLTVKWTRNKTVVHVSRHGNDYLNDQDENFRNRTSLFHEEMTNGNISLKLINVTELDAGGYTCNVPCLQSQVRRGFINLTVEPADQTETKQSGAGTRGRIGIVFSVITVTAIVALAVLMNCIKSTGQEREYPPAQRDNDAVTIPMLNINTTTDCARPNTTGRNRQNREGSQEDNDEVNDEDNDEGNVLNLRNAS